MTLDVTNATPDDARHIAALRTAAADQLTRQYGRGHWSIGATERGVLRRMATSRVLVARRAGAIVATLCLDAKKPWAIDASLFTSVRRPLYLTDMAVAPAWQRRGLGREMLEHAAVVARAWPADALRLDAYDAAAGAAPFYLRCGFREVGRAVYRGVPLVYLELLL
jgi:GNAT superfamily N-acetyltransferase